MRKHSLLALALLLAFSSNASANSGTVQTVYSETDITADDTDATGICFDNAEGEFVFTLDATFNSGTSTMDIKLQHAPIGSTDWIDISGASFTQVTTASARHTLNLALGVNLLSCIRAYVDVGAAGSPDYDAEVKAYYRSFPEQ
jgi:hypothetical protein